MNIGKLSPAIWMAVLMLIFVSCRDTLDHQDDYPQPPLPNGATAKQVPVSRGGEQGGTVSLVFFDDLPGVAYISAAEFQKMMLPGSKMSVEQKAEGIYLLDNGKATATVDTKNETFSSADFMAFTNLMDLLSPGMANVYYDGAPYLRFDHMQLDPATTTVSFDFKKYGIDLRGNGQDVYMPFATLSDLYSDLYYHVAAFNGERIFIITDNNNSSIADVDPDFVLQIFENKTRTPQQAAYSYGELCFVIDNFYGMPGRAPLEDGIQTVGLDAALDAIKDGPMLKRLLKSTDLGEVMLGMSGLQAWMDDGGHTLIGSPILMEFSDNENISNGVKQLMSSAKTAYPAATELMVNFIDKERDKGDVSTNIESQRIMALPEGDEFYRKKGKTAICLYDQFAPIDITGWTDYYAGRAGLPAVNMQNKGDIVVVVDALRRAVADPEVKNLVIDLTCNSGGSLDAVMAITSLIGNQAMFYSDNTLTRQHQQIFYAMDRNFDGRIDARDAEVNYDLRVALLTSSQAFSCGNLLPSLMKDMGYLIIGERTGGGSCAVQNFCTPDGMQYQISSYRGRLTNKQLQNIDGGVEPNVTIPVGTSETDGPDYSQFYNLDRLTSIIDNWYDSKQP